MLTKTANEMIGKRTRIRVAPKCLCNSYGRVDTITLHENAATARVILEGSGEIFYVNADDLECCTCGEGEGCYLCAEKPASGSVKRCRYCGTLVPVVDGCLQDHESPKAAPYRCPGSNYPVNQNADSYGTLGRDDYVTPPEWNTIPRRQRMYEMTTVEHSIYTAVMDVEQAGTDPLLTDAVVLLQQAREKVADYVDREIATGQTFSTCRRVDHAHTVEDRCFEKGCGGLGNKQHPHK